MQVASAARTSGRIHIDQCHFVEWPSSYRTHGLVDVLLLDEFTRGLQTQSAVSVDGVVSLDPNAEALENRNGIRAEVHAGSLFRVVRRAAHGAHLK